MYDTTKENALFDEISKETGIPSKYLALVFVKDFESNMALKYSTQK